MSHVIAFIYDDEFKAEEARAWLIMAKRSLR
jgi:hypothetical protein